MEELKVELSNFDVVSRYTSFVNHWNRSFADVDVVIIRDGIDSEDVLKIKTVAFQCEFVNTLLAITQKKIIMLGSQEKLEALKGLQEKMKKSKYELVLIPKSKESNESIDKFIEEVKSEVKSSGKLKFGGFVKEKQKGKMIEEFESRLEQIDHEWVEISPQVQELLCIKREEDTPLIKKSAKLAEYFYKLLLEEVEEIIDKEMKVKHSDITKKIEKLLIDNRSKYENELGVKPAFADLAYAPIIQSGGTYNLKPNAESDDEILKYDTIMLSVGAKYMEYNTNVVRTLLIDASEEEKTAYQHIYEGMKFITKQMKPNTNIKELFESTYKFICSKNTSYKDKLPNNFGFGIGLEFRESSLIINSKTDKAIKPGMVFNIILSLRDMRTRQGKNYAIMICDTVRISNQGCELLTSDISKKLEDINYSIEDEADEDDIDHADVVKVNVEEMKEGEIFTRSKRRGTQIKVEEEKMGKLRAHQAELLARKTEELKQRLEEGEFDIKGSKKHQVKLEKIQSYFKASDLPRELEHNRIYIDMKNDVIFLPVFGRHVPFHISTLKNVSRQQESKLNSLRFNFNVPGSSNSPIIFPDPATTDYRPIYIKEFTFRTANIEHFATVHKQIKEVQKSHKQKQIMDDTTDTRGGLITVSGRKPCLMDLKMRPNNTGRKSNGVLEAHKNGFRFIERKGDVVDILFSNIKHCFYQPCDNEMIILIHFHLKNAMVVGKKKVMDVQFYTESGVTTEDLTENRGGRFTEFDEAEQDEMERQYRKKLNKEFEAFVKAVEYATQEHIKFDIPSRSLQFTGSPNNNNVTIMPTVNCLVNLTSTPFFVCALDEIEVVFFERVGAMIKNFDLVIIYKDYSRSVSFINAIPIIYKDQLKFWLDSSDIIFFEGEKSINWEKILKRIRDDPQMFVEEEGGWAAFADDDEALLEENEAENQCDSSFDSGAFEGEEESSDFAGEEEDDDEGVEEDSEGKSHTNQDYGDEEDGDEEEDEEEEDSEELRNKKKKIKK